MDNPLTTIVHKQKARRLGSAYKPGYPQTYLKSQRRPIFRKQKAAQLRELERLMITRELTKDQAMDILRRKYAKKEMRFLPTNKRKNKRGVI